MHLGGYYTTSLVKSNDTFIDVPWEILHAVFSELACHLLKQEYLWDDDGLSLCRHSIDRCVYDQVLVVSIFVYITDGTKTFINGNSAFPHDHKQHWHPLGQYFQRLLDSAQINKICLGL